MLLFLYEVAKLNEQPVADIPCNDSSTGGGERDRMAIFKSPSSPGSTSPSRLPIRYKIRKRVRRGMIVNAGEAACNRGREEEVGDGT